MYLIALETSGRRAAAALFKGERHRDHRAPRMLWEARCGPAEPAAQALIPTIAKGLRDCGVETRQLGLVVVAAGPGSFTGLRIGVTSAKTLAYAVGARLVAVPTLAAMAASVPQGAGRLWTLLDAQRGELFAACFPCLPHDPGLALASLAEARGPAVADAARLDRTDSFGATQLVSIDAWLRSLKAGDRVAGPPVARLRDRLPSGVHAVESAHGEPSAQGVGKLGWQMYLRGRTVEPMQLAPQYHRLSAAEEKGGGGAR